MTKVLLIILDGLSDKPARELGDKTPLEAAYTPYLDTLAARGINGLLDPLGPGIPLRSETSHFLLFGYRLEDFPGRGLFDALATGVEFNNEDVLCSTNFAIVTKEDDFFKVITREVRGAEEMMQELSRAISFYEEEGIVINFIYTGDGYGILKLKGDVSDQITDSDPYYIPLPVLKVEPLITVHEKDKAAKTAKILNNYLRWSHQLLSNHPVNKQREIQGEPPINFLLTLWASRRRVVEPFFERYGMKALSIITSHPVLIGLAKELKMNHISLECAREVRDIEAFYRRLLKDINGYLNTYDFIHLNARDTDLAAHTKSHIKKKEVIEAIDRSFEVLVDEILPHHDIFLIITGDHGAPSIGDLLHCGESIPILMVGRNLLVDGVKRFGERAATGGILGKILGKDIMNIVLNATDRINMYGLRLSERMAPARPGRPKGLKIND